VDDRLSDSPGEAESLFRKKDEAMLAVMAGLKELVTAYVEAKNGSDTNSFLDAQDALYVALNACPGENPSVRYQGTLYVANSDSVGEILESALVADLDGVW
jgi:hypothetical protein